MSLRATPTPSRSWPDSRTVWRWHFYAGVFCVPFIVLLAVSGGIYLFTPQINAWLDRPYDRVSFTGPHTTAQAQVDAALHAVPGSTLSAYELPNEQNDATRIIVKSRGERIRVYVHPATVDILKIIPEEDRFTRMVFHFHGELLMGNIGSAFVELAASWAIIMITTGLYLWWPRDAPGLGGIIYPRLNRGSRGFWRDLHAVTGFWISLFVLFLLVTGLPWAKVWGEYFKEIRRVTGTAVVEQDWTVGATSRNTKQDPSGEHLAHTGQTILPANTVDPLLDYSPIDILLPSVRALDLPPPVFIMPPARPEGHWTAKSDTQNRPQRVKVMLDATTGAVLQRENFEDRHVLDRIIGFGVAAHEGQLFGWPNVVLGVFTAGGLLVVVTSGILMWWRRRPSGLLGAPPLPQAQPFSIGFMMLLLFFCLYLPLFAASLTSILLIEKLLLRRVPPLALWLGLEKHV
ncbi:PepSY domain-containing protein [uncultured Nitrospira sp.]|uniref:PepSY-associated TM helix domain-containing protein n=1 Tax=uncultured Nitrospira sp. TaxID=157176 RepID=UPI003140A8C7